MVATVAEPKNPSPRARRNLGGPRSSFTTNGGGGFVMPPKEPPTLFGFSPLQPSGLASSPVNIYKPSDLDNDDLLEDHGGGDNHRGTRQFRQPNFDREGRADAEFKPIQHVKVVRDVKDEFGGEVNAIARRSVKGNFVY
jgi:hypothetical protein